jgi:cytochrome c peroxidase
MRHIRIYAFVAIAELILAASCRRVEPTDPIGSPTATPLKLAAPEHFPPADIPSDNPMTVEGVRLGQMLFYDPILSGDSSMSCGNCHKQEFAFASPNAVDKGIRGIHGNRSSMAIINVAWQKSGFFWDGRAATIEKQVQGPVQNPIEMDLSWPEAVKRLKRHPQYPKLFEDAFGTNSVSQENAAKALAQFLRTMIAADSKYDRAILKGETQLYTDQEMRGFLLFRSDPVFDPAGNLIKPGADCEHCHKLDAMLQPLDGLGAFRNNGLDEAKTIYDFKDPGVGGADSNNYGRFKVPSLRNIELTAPYMHDGRFKTLEEVIDHYNSGGKPSPTLDPKMARVKFAKSGGTLRLTEQDKADLVAFLKTLTDTGFVKDKAFSNPF